VAKLPGPSRNVNNSSDTKTHLDLRTWTLKNIEKSTINHHYKYPIPKLYLIKAQANK